MDTVLNLKDGETSIIGGLLEDSITKNKKKIWLIGDIPVIGPMLSNNNDSKTKGELILAITPRIVRSLMVPDSDVSSFWSGREDEPSAVEIPTPSSRRSPNSTRPLTSPLHPGKLYRLPAAPGRSGRPLPQPPPQPVPAPAMIERGSMSIQVPASVTVGRGSRSRSRPMGSRTVQRSLQPHL